MWPSPLLRSFALSCVLLNASLLLCAALTKGEVVTPNPGVSGDPVFTLSTLNAPWPASGSAYVAAVLADMSTGLTATVAYRGGGSFLGIGDIDNVDDQPPVLSNAQYLADDYTGTTWTSLGPAPWTPRAYGSTIYVPLAQGAVNGILLIACGVSSDFNPTNQVWSSVDMQVDGKRTLGTNWVLNGGQGCKGSGCVKIAFSPRALTGLVVATAFDDSSTVYAYLMAGYYRVGGDNPDVYYNDVYYTVGKGITDWVALGKAPWQPRCAFGIQPITVGGVTGVVIVGGQTSTAVALNEVWTWMPNKDASQGWAMLERAGGSLPRASFINLVRNSTFLFVVGGQEPNLPSPGIPLIQPYATPIGLANWIGTSPGLPNVQRANQSVVAVTNAAAGITVGFVYFGGVSVQGSTTTLLNDVWFAQAQ